MLNVTREEAKVMSPDLLLRLHYEATVEKTTKGYSDAHNVLAYELLHRLAKLRRIELVAMS